MFCSFKLFFSGGCKGFFVGTIFVSKISFAASFNSFTFRLILLGVEGFFYCRNFICCTFHGSLSLRCWGVPLVNKNLWATLFNSFTFHRSRSLRWWGVTLVNKILSAALFNSIIIRTSLSLRCCGVTLVILMLSEDIFTFMSFDSFVFLATLSRGCKGTVLINLTSSFSFFFNGLNKGSSSIFLALFLILVR